MIRNLYLYLHLAGSIVMIAVIISGCQSSKRSELLSFFGLLEENIDQEKLNRYKSTPIDSTGEIVSLIEKEVKDLSSKINESGNLAHFLDSLGSPNTRTFYLSIAFHRYLNQQEFSPEAVFAEIHKISYYDWGVRVKTLREESFRIAKENDSRIGIGDTITVFLPINERFGRLSTFYYGNAMENYPPDVDSLSLIGRLVEKQYEPIFDGAPDSTEIRFLIEILKISESGILIYGKKTGIGDT